MINVERTPVRIKSVINTPFRVLILFVIAVFAVIIMMNSV